MMMKHILTVLALLAFSADAAVVKMATEAQLFAVSNSVQVAKTNAIATANAYTDAAISSAGVVTPGVVTNTVEGIVPAWARQANPPSTYDDDDAKRVVTNTASAGLPRLTVGIRHGEYSAGDGSLSVGKYNVASGEGAAAFGEYNFAIAPFSFAFGYWCSAQARDSIALGVMAESRSNQTNSFTWSGTGTSYLSRGAGTFSINPEGGLAGVYVGVQNLQTLFGQKMDASAAYTKSETEQKIVELAPAPGDYVTVSNAAMNAVQIGQLTNTALRVASRTWDAGYQILWEKQANLGGFYEVCVTNVNLEVQR